MNRFFVTLIAVSMACVSCFDNPLDYPYAHAGITNIVVEGQKSVSIDNSRQVVEIVLDEYADITNLPVKEYSFTENAIPSSEFPEVLDLSTPFKISYQTYPDQIYEWTITAVQPIERYVVCDNMIGEAEFNLSERSVVAYFPEVQSLSSIKFKKIKLEAQGSKILSTTGYDSEVDVTVAVEEDVHLPMELDCVISRKFKVLYKGEEIIWTFTAVHKVIELEVTSVNAWCYKAEIKGAFKGTGSPEIQYREATSSEWVRLQSEASGVVVSADVDNLDSGTEYYARVVNGESVSEEFKFVTETPDQLSNMSFDEWHQGEPNGYTWYPMPEGAPAIWSCANTGVNMMSAVNSTRPEYEFTVKRGSAAARMESVKVFGMFAAGNVFTGEFLKATITGGVGAELSWGTPFTSRPYSLKGYYAYSPKPIDNVSENYQSLLGNMDKCQILVFLTDWAEPFMVKTASNTFVDLDNDPNIIALGKIETDEDTGGEYKEFECVLEYRDTFRKPKYIVAVACSSLYGDYFTGGLGSMMYVDEWEFIYR